MWGMKATTIPVVMGALGLINEGIVKYTEKIPGDIKIQELQKISLLGTSRNFKKGTIHQADFNPILTLGPRMGLVMTTY